MLQAIIDYVKTLLVERSEYTGKLELNFKDGVLMDIHETKKTKINKKLLNN